MGAILSVLQGMAIGLLNTIIQKILQYAPRLLGMGGAATPLLVFAQQPIHVPTRPRKSFHML